MLLEHNPIAFKKIVFLTENAYFENKLNEKAFNEVVKVYSSISKGIIVSDNIVYFETDKEKANAQYAVFLFMTDTISIFRFCGRLCK